MAVANPLVTDKGADVNGDLNTPRRRWVRPRLWWVAGVLAVMTVAALWWSQTNGAVAAVETGTETSQQLIAVSTGTFQSTVTAEGTVAAADTEDLSFSTSGTVTAVNVAVGDQVRVGQVIATIDATELELALAEAQAEYDELVARLAESVEDEASDEQIALYEARVAVSADRVGRAEEALAGAELRAGVDGTVTSVNLVAGEQLGSGGQGGVSMSGSATGSGNSSANIGSGTNQFQTGSTASGSAHMSLVSIGSYKVELSVDSAEIDQIAVGQQVTLSESASASSGFPGFGGGPGQGGGPGGVPGGGFGGGPGQGGGPGGGFGGNGQAGPPDGFPGGPTGSNAVQGEVTEVAAIADASSGVARFTVTVTFTDESGEFYVGTRVLAEISTGERSDVIQVPTQVISSGGGPSTVTVAVAGTLEGTLETRTVITGQTNGFMTEIVSGLAPGELVVFEVTIPAEFGPGGEGGFQPPGGAPGQGGPDGGGGS